MRAQAPGGGTAVRGLLGRCALLIALIAAPSDEANARGDGAAVQWLQQRLVELARDSRLAGGSAAVAVLDLRSRRLLAQHNGDAGVSIASNAKLFTSAAALAYLGPGYRFQTRIYGLKTRREGVLRELYVKGYGDPSIREHTLWRIARDLRNTGIRRIVGGVTIDESFLDSRRLPPLFETRETDAYYRPAVGPLSLEDNVVWIGVRPASRAGKSARVTLSPRNDQVQLEGSIETVRRKRTRLQIRTEERDGSTVVVVDGRIQQRNRTIWQRRRIADPGQYFGTALRYLLRDNGIRVGRESVKRGRIPRRARLLLRRYSDPLARVVSEMNKESNNAQAELLLKVLGAVHFGRRGSSRLGLRAVASYLEDVGLSAQEYLLRNGSGLYDATRFSARQVVQLLAHARASFRYGPEFVSSLPIAGVDGTLDGRFGGSGSEGYVRAKTGTLAHVVALSGYAGSASGSAPLAFSILLTELPPGAIRPAREVADEMAATLVTYLEYRATREQRTLRGAKP
jgi:D-alanyl-D-alanine carboxypeptidase/D-alanyl-D-alanine-endopeptidase (penicillin-binding protein 4)